jgi:threonine/homoserine/homoserine lactone efflux protein
MAAMIPDMDTFIPVIGLLTVAAITPGPNNMLAMEAGAQGVGAVARVILGVLAGSLLLLALVALGMDAVLAAYPAAVRMLALAGGVYLLCLGFRLLSPREGAEGLAARGAPSAPKSVALFQLLNPKAWLMVTTAVALLPGTAELPVLALFLAPISAICLSLWAMAGAAAMRLLQSPKARRSFDFCIGLILAVCGASSVAHALV